MSDPRARSRKDLGPLHQLLIEASPEDENGQKSVYVLAAAMGVLAPNLYQRTKFNRMTTCLAEKVVAASEGRVTMEDVIATGVVLTDGTDRRKKDLGPLHDLLLKACPPTSTGQRGIGILARRIGCTEATLFRIIKLRKMTPEKAQEIATASEGRVQIEDLYPYVFTR